jgi:hypothetical protein
MRAAIVWVERPYTDDAVAERTIGFWKTLTETERETPAVNDECGGHHA